ncbi:CCAAT/enhancer-binding protein zeta-like, partial [Plakobranchus ocellatus]
MVKAKVKGLKKSKKTSKNASSQRKEKLSQVEDSESYIASHQDESDIEDLEDLMTEEDKNILQSVKDEEDESDIEIKEDGKDIPLSEISGFLKKLDIEKFRPSDITEADLKLEIQRSKLDKRVMNGEKTELPSGSIKEIKSFNNDEQAKETVKKVKAATKFLSDVKTRKHLLFKPEDMWREEKLHPLPSHPPDAKLLTEAENLAQKLMQDELALYFRFKEHTKRSEARWMKTVLASGTLSDKMAALTLLVQESPLHNMSSLDSLISMAGKKGKREAMMAVDTLRDLFLTGLLPDTRKLRAFNQQPFLELETLSKGSIDARDKFLMMWFFESLLKKKYAELIKSLGDLSFDTLQATKEKAVSTISQLLSGKPEQENILLSMLVNKLGDPAVKSKATYLLTKLVEEHPNMKSVIVSEVQQLLHRPNISPRAQYYAICYLVQLRLSKTDGDLASQLIKIYFYFFQTYLKSGEVANKMMSALLTGVNRAYVYATTNKEELVDQMDKIYKIIPSVNFHTGVQALMLLFQVIDASSNAADRYYACLYRKLADPALKNSSKQSIFMNLIFKSLKRDIVDRRIKAFLKRILQIYSQQPPQVICGILIILSQILTEKPGLLEVNHISEGAWSEDEEEKFVDQPLPEEFEDQDMSHSSPKRNEEDERPQALVSGQINGAKGSWVHRVNFGGTGRSSSYDPFSRNPLYSRAELDCVWELQQLARHYHPSVRLYAESLLKGQPIKYDGDPLKDFTLIRFLDRFVYKNPKKDLASNMRKFKGSGPTGIRAVPVNSKEFLEAGEQGVPVDEKFFLQYFVEKAKRKGDETSDVDSDADSVRDEEFDAFLDGMEKDDDIGDIDLDFAGDKKKTQSSKKNAASNVSDDEDEDEDDEDDDLDLSDDDLAAEFKKELEGLEDSDNENLREASSSKGGKRVKEEDIEFSADEDDELAMMMLGGPKQKKRKREIQDDDDDFMDELEDSTKRKKKS